MNSHLSEHRQRELKRIAGNANSAREVFQHAVGEAFLRFERNVDAELVRILVDELNSREQAAQWMAGLFLTDNTQIPYEAYLNEGSEAVLRLLKSE